MKQPSPTNASSANAPAIEITVVLAHPRRQQVQTLNVKNGTTAREAFLQSVVWRYFSHITEFTNFDPETIPLGMFGKTFGTRDLPNAESYVLRPGDRIEALRPLLADPKEIRRQRAAAAKRDKG